VTVTSGSSLGSLPEAPTKDGSTFGHWYTSEDGKEEPFTASTAVTADITVYAKWLVNAYKATFDPAGGIVSEPFQRVEYNTSLGALLLTPTKTGNDFDGWYTEPDGGGTKFTADTPVTGDITIYAQWSATVRFDTDVGSAAPPTVTVIIDTTLASLPTEPTRSGNDFGGWYTARNGGGKEFTASTKVTESKTVYAKWSATVAFNTDEGSAAPQSVTVISGTTLASLPAPPTKAGNVFGGWFTDRNGGGKEFTASTKVTESKTVYAKWSATVTFVANGGSPATQTRTVTSGSQIGGLPVPTKDGYTLGGWYTAENGSGTAFTAETPVTESKTVYAKWLAPNFSSLQAFLDWLKSYAEAGGNYTYTLHANETIKSNSLEYGGKRVCITIQGDSAERTVTWGSSGPRSPFSISSGVTLTLGNNLTLRGGSLQGHSVVNIYSGSTLIMEPRSKITGNTATYGDGVYVRRGTFNRNGGTVSGSIVYQ
jgi:uncharacterized repeat protein (TIGR02543 family)